MNRMYTQFIFLLTISLTALGAGKPQLDPDVFMRLAILYSPQAENFRELMNSHFNEHIWEPGTNGGKLSLLTKVPMVGEMDQYVLAASDVGLELNKRLRQMSFLADELIKAQPKLDYQRIVEELADIGLKVQVREIRSGLISGIFYALSGMPTSYEYSWKNRFPLSESEQRRVLAAASVGVADDRMERQLNEIEENMRPRGSAPSVYENRIRNSRNRAMAILEDERAVIDHVEALTGKRLAAKRRDLKAHSERVAELLKIKEGRIPAISWQSRVDKLSNFSNCGWILKEVQ